MKFLQIFREWRELSLQPIPHCQAMLLARHIRGDTQYYPLTW